MRELLEQLHARIKEELNSGNYLLLSESGNGNTTVLFEGIEKPIYCGGYGKKTAFVILPLAGAYYLEGKALEIFIEKLTIAEADAREQKKQQLLKELEELS